MMLRRTYSVAVMSMMLLTNASVRSAGCIEKAKCFIGWTSYDRCQAQIVCDRFSELSPEKQRAFLQYQADLRQRPHKRAECQRIWEKRSEVRKEIEKQFVHYMNTDDISPLENAMLKEARPLSFKAQWNVCQDDFSKWQAHSIFDLQKEMNDISEGLLAGLPTQSEAQKKICRDFFKEQAKELGIEWPEEVVVAK